MLPEENQGFILVRHVRKPLAYALIYDMHKLFIP